MCWKIKQIYMNLNRDHINIVRISFRYIVMLYNHIIVKAKIHRNSIRIRRIHV